MTTQSASSAHAISEELTTNIVTPEMDSASAKEVSEDYNVICVKLASTAFHIAQSVSVIRMELNLLQEGLLEIVPIQIL